MKEQKTKASPKLGGRTSPIERYNTRTDRKTSQSGPLVFSAFVFALFFVVAIAAGVALVRGIDVWVVLVAFGVASLAAMSIHIAMQWEKVVVMRFGKFHRIRSAGLYFTIPFVDQTALRADQRVVVTGFGAEETLTSDLVPINVDAVLFWMVWDAQKACLEVENYYNSVLAGGPDGAARRHRPCDGLRGRRQAQPAGRGARSGSSRRSTSLWGITVLSVEIRDIIIPQEPAGGHVGGGPGRAREATPACILAEVERDISEMLVDAAAGLRKERGGPAPADHAPALREREGLGRHGRRPQRLQRGLQRLPSRQDVCGGGKRSGEARVARKRCGGARGLSMPLPDGRGQRACTSA